jgi:hypothetical protein
MLALEIRYVAGQPCVPQIKEHEAEIDGGVERPAH